MAGDASNAIRLLHALFPGAPLFLLGESMGGAISILAVTRAGAATAVDGVILVAPAVGGCPAMGLLPCAVVHLTAALMPALPLSGSAFQALAGIRLSDNDEALRQIQSDPLNLHATRADSLVGLVDMMGQAMTEAARLEVPTLILHGDQDEVVRRETIAQLVRNLPADARLAPQLATYSHGYHLLLRDRGSDRVVNDIVGWMLKTIARKANPMSAVARD
jgi:alpha-beta hydrolase superfamily lysophospholipase